MHTRQLWILRFRRRRKEMLVGSLLGLAALNLLLGLVWVGRMGRISAPTPTVTALTLNPTDTVFPETTATAPAATPTVRPSPTPIPPTKLPPTPTPTLDVASLPNCDAEAILAFKEVTGFVRETFPSYSHPTQDRLAYFGGVAYATGTTRTRYIPDVGVLDSVRLLVQRPDGILASVWFDYWLTSTDNIDQSYLYLTDGDPYDQAGVHTPEDRQDARDLLSGRHYVVYLQSLPGPHNTEQGIAWGRCSASYLVSQDECELAAAYGQASGLLFASQDVPDDQSLFGWRLYLLAETDKELNPSLACR